MIKFILGFFGYIKVPQSAIRMSIRLEEGYKFLSEKIPEAEAHYKAAKTLTKFLRTGLWRV